MKKFIFTFVVSVFGLLNIFAQQTNNALHFQNNNYVDINNISQKLSPLTKFTIELWVKYKGIENTDYNTFYGVNPSDHTNRFIIRTSGPFDGISGTVAVLLENSAPIYLVGTTLIDDFECHHIAFTYDNQVCKLYIDGNLETTLNYSFSFMPDDLHSLGQEYDNNPTALSAFYNGMMDDFRIWNYARSQAEIIASKATELVGNEPGLIVNYDFNQGVQSGNNTSINSLLNKADPTRNGTLMNFTLNGPSSNFIDGNCVICDLLIDDVQVVNATCGNSNGKLTILYSGQTSGIKFSIDNGVTYQTSNVFDNLSAGTYQVKITDDSGCNETTVATVSDSPVFTVVTTATPVDCGMKNGTTSATVSGGNGTITYVWSPGNLTGQTVNNLPVGTYTVTATDESGCIGTSTVLVGQNGSLNLQANPYTAVVEEDSSINLNASFSPYIPGTIYEWTPPTGLSCTDCPNPIATPTETTTYTVQITTPDGCTADTNITLIYKIRCGEYFVPTIFSPNGDGVNDEFKIYGNCITSINMKVYDRWGELVFESDDQSYGWDGTYKGEIMNSTSFVYLIDVVFNDDRTEHLKGSLSLVR